MCHQRPWLKLLLHFRSRGILGDLQWSCQTSFINTSWRESSISGTAKHLLRLKGSRNKRFFLVSALFCFGSNFPWFRWSVQSSLLCILTFLGCKLENIMLGAGQKHGGPKSGQWTMFGCFLWQVPELQLGTTWIKIINIKNAHGRKNNAKKRVQFYSSVSNVM